MDRDDFLCPTCRKSLIANDKQDSIRLWGILECQQFSVGSFFLLSKKLGVYGGYAENPNIKMNQGTSVSFFCPHLGCRASLQAFYSGDLSEILWCDKDGKEHTIAFHNSLGQEMTFVIDPSKGELIASHGKHAENWVQRWGPFPEWR